MVTMTMAASSWGSMAAVMEGVTDRGFSCRIHLFRRFPRAAATCLIPARLELPSLHPPPHDLPLAAAAAAAARPGPATSRTPRVRCLHHCEFQLRGVWGSEVSSDVGRRAHLANQPRPRCLWCFAPAKPHGRQPLETPQYTLVN